MSSPLDHGVVLLTGASSGIGLAMARQIAPRASALVLVARRGERLEHLAAELKAAYPTSNPVVHAADVSDLAAIEALVTAVERQLGPIDVLINNAGFGDLGFFERSAPEKNVAMIGVNVVGLTALTRRVLPGMVARGRGGVLFVSSGFGLAWMPLFATYTGTKAYVSTFAECLAAELTGTGVRVTHVCPGPVATEFNDVAGMPAGQKVPGFIEISPDQCARESIWAFDRGRTLCVPGKVMWLAIALGRISPWWLVRPVYGLMARFARRKLPPLA